jgi:hypothetical protein
LTSQIVISKPAGGGEWHFAPYGITQQGVTVFETIRQMLEAPIPAKKAIGFHAKIQTSGKPNGTVQSKRKHQKTRNL